MKNKRITAYILLTAMTVFLLGCGSAKAGTAAGTEEASEEMSTSALTGEQQEADENVIKAEEETEDTSSNDSASSAAANESLRDLYAMETYDTVPEELRERHDDVDYGTIEEDVEYYSATAGDNKYCNVLLPAGYDESQEYPVFYVIHGWGGAYDDFVHEGSGLQTLYGNMLSEGLAVPMIIVGVDMYTDPLADKESKSDEEMRLS